MEYRDLNIETRREAPSRTRSEGDAFLIRGGYYTSEHTPTMLGRRALSRLELLATTPEEFFRQVYLRVVSLDNSKTIFETPAGDQEVLHCPSCSYAAERELARFGKLALPAEPLLPMLKISTPHCDTIDALATFLGVPREKTAKAMMYSRLSDGRFVLVTLRGDMQLSEAKLLKLIGDFHAASSEAILSAGAAPGYASAVGLQRSLIVVDDLIPDSMNLVAGANETGYHVENVNYGRDYTADMVADLSLARPGDPCPNCGTGLQQHRAILVANPTGFLLENVLWALAEAHHDQRGLCLPSAAAPFQIHLLDLASKRLDTHAAAAELYQSLEAAGAEVLYDGRDERAGVKFNDADLIGCPLRLTVSEKGLEAGMVELKYRDRDEIQSLPLGETVHRMIALVQAQNA